MLRHVDGLSVAAVADHLGRTVQATDQVLTRARAAFRIEYRDQPMSDDLDLRGIDQRHEPDPRFLAALERRIEAVVAGTDPGSLTETGDVATIDLEPTRPPSGPRRRSRRVAHGVLAIAVAAAVVTTMW